VEVCRITSDQFIGTLNDSLRFSIPPRQAKIEKKFKKIKGNESFIANFELKSLNNRRNSIEFPPTFDYYQYFLN